LSGKDIRRGKESATTGRHRAGENEKGKMKKEKGGKPPVDGWHRARKNYELSVGCLGKNYELRIARGVAQWK